MRQVLQSQRGSALLITLCLVGMLSLLAVLAVDNSNTDMELTFNRANADGALYIAEAGAKRAFLVLNDTNSWRGGFNNIPFSDGRYSVRLIDSAVVAALDDTVIIRSAADLNEAEGGVELWTVPEYIYPWSHAMFAEGWINFDKGTCTDSYNSDSGSYAATVLQEDGSIGTNGSITGSKLVDVGGDAFTAKGGNITLGPGSAIHGDSSTTKDSVSLDAVPDSEYSWAEANSAAPLGLSGTGYSYNNGNKALTLGTGANLQLQSGVYYFSSIDLSQSANITLAPGASVMIYVTGDIHLGQYSTINAGGAPSDMLVFSKGTSLQFDQGNVFNGAYYGPNAHVQYDQTTSVFGSLVANTIKLDADACFHYDRNLAKVKHNTTGAMLLAAWNEL